ncbi:unnamed protein product [Lampetra planeri]
MEPALELGRRGSRVVVVGAGPGPDGSAGSGVPGRLVFPPPPRRRKEEGKEALRLKLFPLGERVLSLAYLANEAVACVPVEL